MPITLITGPANAGKAQVVMDSVRRHLAHGEEPLLIVPTRADADHYRRELAGEGTAMGVQVERFEGLIAETASRAGVTGPVLGSVARERVLAAIATRAGAAATPGYVRALSAFVAELQVRRVTPARLSRALSECALGAEHGHGVGALFEQYSRRLRELGRVDPEQRAARALDALRREPALWGGTPVLLYGFDDLTRLQIDAIETLGAIVDAQVTVSLTYEPERTAFAGRANAFHAIAPLAAEHRALPPRADYYASHARAPLSHLERSLFEPDAVRVDPADAVLLLEGGGERAELELVAREIAALLAGGMAAEEIAVVLRTPGVAADLIEEVFAAAHIPYALQRRRRFADTAIGRALIGWLRCAPAREESDFSEKHGDAISDATPRSDVAPMSHGQAADLLAWLRAPGLLERPEPADWLEAATRRMGVASADQARALWERKHWRLRAIDQLAAAQERGGRALIERVTRELDWLFSAPRRGRASLIGDEQAELDEARALVAGTRALSALGELERVAPEAAIKDASELARALEEVELVSGERPTLGAVAVLDPLALRARRVRALFVCGLQEGVFPAPARSQPFLSEEERRRLAETAGLRLGEHEDALAAERYLLYAAVSRPRERLVLSWHVAGDDGAPAARSLFVDDICDLFDASLTERVSRRSLGAVDRPTDWPEIGERAAGLASVPMSTAISAPPSPPVSTSAVAPPRAQGPGALRDEELLAELRAHTWSASSLEVWMSCPMRWLVERLLRARDLDPDPEPIARGGLAHAALKDTLEALKLDTGSARLTPVRLERACALLRVALAANEGEFPLSAAPERRPGMRRRLQADLERYLRHAAECESPLEPSRFELGFGFKNDFLFESRSEAGDERGGEGLSPGASLPAFDLGGGTMLRGRIDRIDVGAGGEAVVYDYKGRIAPPAAKWGAAGGNVQVALYMRAAEQLLGLRAVGGFYQPLAGGDLRARGVLDEDGGVEIECVRGERREHSEMREILDDAVAAARKAAAQAGRGELRAQPRTCAYRGGCSYPTICRCEG
jgi:ATP-dependent helicase/DNAse subunit B